MKRNEVIINYHDVEINNIIVFLENFIYSKYIPSSLYNTEENWMRLERGSELLGKNILLLSPDRKESGKIAIEFANWFLPRMKRFLELEIKEDNLIVKAIHDPKTGVYIDNKKYKNEKEIIWIFEQIASGIIILDKRFKEAQKIFEKIFLSLWW